MDSQDRTRWPLIILLALGIAPIQTGRSAVDDSPGVETWTDKRLPVTKGLLLWLDGAKLADGRKTLGHPPLVDGDPVDLWPDGSGGKRHVGQKQAAIRPTYHQLGDYRAVRFDGRSTHLRLSSIGHSFHELTVFVVAAPYSSPEPFSAMLGMSQKGKNDFETGLNIDQAVGNPPRLEVVNIEGAGNQGMKNLAQETVPYGTVVRLCVSSSPGMNGTTLWINGKRQGSRDRAGRSIVHMDELVIGARYYTLGGPPEVRGFLDGDIAEVLIFDHVLSEVDRAAVENYLYHKYVAVPFLPIPGVAGGKPVVRVKDPPPVQMFVPGFTVRELPVALSNVNNLLYRPDGKLIALGYDGNIYLLSDSDHDGLEDKVEVYWENKGRIRAPIGMALTPRGYRHGEGVLVASKGKCSLLIDTDGDGKADKEVVVADGWKELPHGVDALGVAVDPKDGSVYFGLGCQDYTNAYGVGKNGVATYDLKGERGTILRVAPDFKSREIVATGIRFPVGMRFNRDGDLFVTDQEGATWLPNGNPLDELLHIEKGRHYGFPPRHPQHLPTVIDEPSTFDYGPQHQSTCGLNFNESVNNGPTFGPKWWKSDVFVTGYSRGKLYRTKLVKTPAGYVAQTQLLACLNMLACDVCVSPAGDLVVACHSGGPDWGSGPTGKGKLYKITYTGQELPQPVLAWVQSPREVRIAFDRPLAAEQLAGVTKATIEFGQNVFAGDRFESLWPGYKVVTDQRRTPRFDLAVNGVNVTSDRRTLILTTAPHPGPAGYALTLPGLGRLTIPNVKPGEAAQVTETDLRYDLCGVEAEWRAMAGHWSGWLPTLDLAVAQSLTRSSADHDTLWEMCHEPGELTLRTQLNLKDMLRPAVQPGSRIDYEWPTELVTLVFRSQSEFTVQVAEKRVTAERQTSGEFVVLLSLNGKERIPVVVHLRIGGGGSKFGLSWSTAEDSHSRAFPLHRMQLPWVPAKRQEGPRTSAVDVPELKGGNWTRGRNVFFSDQGGCVKCHAIGSEGGKIGPDLSNLSQRDYHSVLRDIVEPSFAINPDYISHTVTLLDGRVLTGSVRNEGARLLIGDAEGKVTTVLRADVENIIPNRVSIMPEGLPKQLGPERMRDLLTFLLTEPPRMPDYGRGQAPEPRSRKEVARVLADAPVPPERIRKLHVVLVAGRKDHGPGEHDYPAWKNVWARLLSMADQIIVGTADEWPSADQVKTADVLIFYQQGKWIPERARDMDTFLGRGGGAVYLHYAVDGGLDAPGFAQRIGLAWKGGQSKFRHGPLELGFEISAKHPIARNFNKVQFHDESYWQLVGDPNKITLLASGKEDNRDQPLFWTLEPAKGRVFVSIPGHFAWTFDDPLFRILVFRGIAWTAREPVDRFNDLIVPGSRMKE
jgi:putative heme-binding domain-containing protein